MTSPDETTKTRQDNSTAAPGGSSGKGSGTTSKDKGKLYTDAAIQKIKSDAAAEAGRQRKAAEQERDTFKQDLQSTQSRLDALEREANESRLAEARGDPAQLRTYQREQTVVKRERQVEERDRDITRREGQIKTDRDDLDKDKRVVSIAYVAAKHGLETEELESLGISDLETLERVAEKLAAVKPVETTGEEEETPGGEEPLTPDSGATTGGAEALTVENVEKMPLSSLKKAIEKAQK